MNIVIPIAGPNSIVKDSLNNEYCKPLMNVMEKPIIELIYNNIKGTLSSRNKFIFIVNESDCNAFYLDSVINILDPHAHIIKAKGTTKGALCSCMLAMGHMDMDDELLIVNGDQYVDMRFDDIIKQIKESEADGSLVTFDSIHPKWSYAKLGEDGNVIETAEKRPISRNASIGIYYFKRAGDFLEGAKSVIRKDTNTNGHYYVSSVYNEMILKNKRIAAVRIQNEVFFPLDSHDAIEAFVGHIRKKMMQ